VSREPLHWNREINWFQRKAGGKTLLSKVRRTTLAANVYMIWRSRNLLFFQQKQCRTEEMYRKIREVILLYRIILNKISISLLSSNNEQANIQTIEVQKDTRSKHTKTELIDLSHNKINQFSKPK